MLVRMLRIGEERRSKMSWAWTGAGVSEEAVASGNGSSCLNPVR